MLRQITRKKIRERLLQAAAGREDGFVDFRDARRAVLLLEYDQYPELQPVIRELEAAGMTVRVYLLHLCREKASETPAYPAAAQLITRADLKWGCTMPRQALLDAFAAEKADVAIDLTDRMVLPFYVLLSHSPVRMKMGLRKAGLTPYNFQIQTSEVPTPVVLGEILLRYWRAFVVKAENNL